MGDKVSGMLNEDLPFGIPLQVAAVCLCTHMLIPYLIKNVVFCGFFQAKLDPERANPKDMNSSSWISWNVFVGVTLVAAMLTANIVPFFSEAVDVLGALFAPVSCWIIPLALYVRFWYDAGENGPKVSYAHWALIVAEFAFAAVLGAGHCFICTSHCRRMGHLRHAIRMPL